VNNLSPMSSRMQIVEGKTPIISGVFQRWLNMLLEKINNSKTIFFSKKLTGTYGQYGTAGLVELTDFRITLPSQGFYRVTLNYGFGIVGLGTYDNLTYVQIRSGSTAIIDEYNVMYSGTFLGGRSGSSVVIDVNTEAKRAITFFYETVANALTFIAFPSLTIEKLNSHELNAW